MLAKIHNMKIPIRKRKNILFDNIQEMTEVAYKNLPIRKDCEEAKYENLLSRDLSEEWKIVQRIMKKVNAPSVFCHCDFRGSNILVTDQGLICIDLEYSMYGARAYDLSTMLNEWDKTELFDGSMGKVPNKEIIMNVINIYISHCERLNPGYASKPQNQPDVIYKEVRVYFLLVYIFFLSIMVKTEESIIPNMPFDRKQFLGYVDQCYGFYRSTKADLLKDGFIDPEDL